jgi:hypothetical protein
VRLRCATPRAGATEPLQDGEVGDDNRRQADQAQPVVGQRRGAPEPLQEDDGDEAQPAHQQCSHHGSDVEQPGGRRPRRGAHHVAFRRLGLEDQRARRVDDEFEQHDVNRQEQHRPAEQRQQRQADDRHVHGEQVAHRLAQVGEDAPAGANRLDQRREAIVEEDDRLRSRGRRRCRAGPWRRRHRRRAAPARR